MKSKMNELKFIALSGTVGVTENLYIYESEDKMMIIDCGVGFPDIEMHGVDLVIPDFTYIIENKHKLSGVVLTQGHEDHIGALPFLLREVNVQLWAAPLVKEFLKDKFEDYKVKDPVINMFNPDSDCFKVGPFTLYPFRVAHSVPDSVGFAIDTPQGRVFHVPEHKMDQNPVDGMGFDLQRAKDLVGDKILFLASDCLGSNKPGYTKSELGIEKNMYEITREAKEAVYMTAISSNIGRFQQMVNVAQNTGRKVVFVGRSIQRKTEIAFNLGYLKYKKGTVITPKQAERYSRSDLLYIVSGCYGQVGSSLYKISLGEHDRIDIQKGDTMIFSADPAPPYTKESEDFVVDNLIEKGVDVHYYDTDEGLYVSGHGGQEDIKDLFRLTNPKYYIPIGGTIRFMHSYKKLAVDFGAEPSNVFEMKPGESLIFENGVARKGKRLPSKKVLVHGLGIGDVGKVVLGDRGILGNEGIAVTVIKLRNGKIVGIPEIISRGFVFEKIEKGFLKKAGLELKKEIDKTGKFEKDTIKKTSENFLTKYFFDRIGRKPMILPVTVEI